MRASTAYFIGAGTMIAAIALGLGGGLVAGNIMNPVSPKQGPDVARAERRAEPATPVAAPASIEGVQYLAGSQAFGVAVAPPAQAEPEAASAERPAPVTAVNEPEARTVQPAPPAEQASSNETASSPDNAYAKTRETDVKRAASERRHVERRHWAERRRYEPRYSSEPRGRTDWDDVARNVREDSQARDVASSRRTGFPQIRLFGSDDD